MRVASRGARTAIGLAIALLLAFPLLAAAALHGRSERSAPRALAARSAVHGGTASLYTCSTTAENISPCTTSSGPGPNTTLTIQYAIENNSIEDDDIGLSCTPSGVVVSCDVPGDILVRSGGRGTFTLTYTTGPNGGSGSVTVNAFGISSLTATVSVTVDVSPPSMRVPESTPVRRTPMRYVPYNGAGSPPSWLSERPRRRRVVVTSGIALGRYDAATAAQVTRSFVESVASPDIDLVVATGTPLEGLSDTLPAGSRVATGVPFHLLLPACDAVIHHGGAGTALTAVVSGVPQLVVPQAPPYAEIADRVAKHVFQTT